MLSDFFFRDASVRLVRPFLFSVFCLLCYCGHDGHRTSLSQGLSGHATVRNFQAHLSRVHRTRVFIPISPVGPMPRPLPFCCRYLGTALSVQTELSYPLLTLLCHSLHEDHKAYGGILSHCPCLALVGPVWLSVVCRSWGFVIKKLSL